MQRELIFFKKFGEKAEKEDEEFKMLRWRQWGKAKVVPRVEI